MGGIEIPLHILRIFRFYHFLTLSLLFSNSLSIKIGRFADRVRVQSLTGGIKKETLALRGYSKKKDMSTVDVPLNIIMIYRGYNVMSYITCKRL